MRIVKLELDENSVIGGIDAVALVEQPAIEEDFLMFAKQEFQETYTDYPKAAIEAAKQGIKRNEALGNKCGTQVGKVRAQQLAQGKPISLDTVRRMRAFLIRQRNNYDLAISRKDYDACGYISYLLWGGPAALPWAEKVLRKAEREEMAEVGPRGGIKRSPKAPKSKTKNPDPKGQGTARGSAKTTRGAKVDKQTEKTLQKKSDDFNERYKKKLGYGTTIGQLKAVYQRGLGAYNTSRSPEVASRGGAKQWAMARVNAYLYLVKNGRPQNKKYTTDYDLLPKEHPKSEKMSKIIEELIRQEMSKPIGMIDNMPVYATIKEAEAKAKEIGCEGYHEHMVGKDVIGYMPCKSHTDTSDKILSELPQEKQDAIIESLTNVGITEQSLIDDGYVEVPSDQYNTAIEQAFAITSDPNKGSVADRGQFKVLFKYEGPRDSKNRDFCREVLNKNLLFRKEDINELSVQVENQEFGFYDIFKWRGSYNCRHVWTAKLFTKTNLDPKRALTDLDGLSSAESTKPLDPNTGKTTGMGTDTGAQTFAREELDEKQMLIGPLMVPNKLIKRIDEDGEYYVYFDEDTIERLAYKTMEDKIGDRVNIEHNQKQNVKDVYLAETWLIKDEDKDKSRYYGFDLPVGTWMGIYKINNDEIWNEYVSTGKVKGFSVEGYFAQKLQTYATTR
jgi:hypothetical protein